MPDRFDPAGTAPGLANKAEADKQNIIHMKCRSEMQCDSIQAVEIVIGGANNPIAGKPHYRTYQCIKCQHTWTVNTGGYAGF
jgi:hypothetical protein